MPGTEAIADVATAARFEAVWDVPVRLFHWLLVALLGFSWWSGDHHAMDWHRRSGYVILGLVVFRLYWGVVGSRTARFAHFVRGPRSVLTYVKALGERPHHAAPGHNPGGGWSVVVMLACLSTMVVAGLFSVDVDGLESGPLADHVSFDAGRTAAAVHHLVFDVLLGLVALHVAAILFYLLRLRHDLVTPMISGRRRSATSASVGNNAAPPWRAALGLLLAAAFTYAVARGFRW